MNNEFLKVLAKSFKVYLETSSRSNEKLKVLHGYVSSSLSKKLGFEYKVHSLGYQAGKEKTIKGRYMDKNVDITVEKNNKTVAGIGLKFVMSNYSQNSNNYFENMLGETANIRTNNSPYFQIFIIAEKVPYFDTSKKIKGWDTISSHNLDKYIKLSGDNIDTYYHTPNKTLFILVKIDPLPTNLIKNKTDYIDFFNNNSPSFSYSVMPIKLGQAGIYNDFENFIEKIYYTIKSL